jgi:hypothetical protein
MHIRRELGGLSHGKLTAIVMLTTFSKHSVLSQKCGKQGGGLWKRRTKPVFIHNMYGFSTGALRRVGGFR